MLFRSHTKPGREELPHFRGQGQRPRVPGCDSTGTAEKSYPSERSGAAAERSYPASKVRGGGQEALPHAPTPEARGDGREDAGATLKCLCLRAPASADPCGLLSLQPHFFATLGPCLPQ